MSEPRLEILPPLPPSVYWRRAAGARPPFPVAEPNVVLYSRARHGIYMGVRHVGLRPGDEVLVPAYHHGSEIEALVRAGLVCRFYEGTERLEPDETELESLLGPRVRMLHVTHYLGFPQDAPRWRAWCREHELLLLEDAAQAWLANLRDGSPAGSAGDVAVFCLYKAVAVPDGAALRLSDGTRGLTSPDSSAPGVADVVRCHARWLVSRSGTLSRLGHRNGGPYDAAQDFALGDAGRGPLGLTVGLLPRAAAGDPAAARRANYRRLLDALRPHVPAPFDDVPPGASPFCFPVETERKAEVLASLEHACIAAINLWSVPHPCLPVERFPQAARRRAGTIGLPVHQELRETDVARIAAAATAALGGAPQRAKR
jgi:perosamine synthetase